MKFYIFIFAFLVLLTGCSKPEQQIVVYKTDKSKERVHIEKESISVLQQEQNFDLAPQNFTNGLEKTKIALVYGLNNIGKYSIESINVISTYLSTKYENYSLKVFDIGLESKESYDNVLDQLNELDINNAIFLVTEEQIESLLENEKNKDIDIYLPIINKNSLENNITNSNIIFGGIDYSAQFDEIITKIQINFEKHKMEANETNISINNNIFEIYDNKPISKKLHTSFISKVDNYKSIGLFGKNPSYAKILTKHNDLNESTVILNTSIIKSSIVLSQLRANEIYPKYVYSTQINYTPLVFVLTQYEDRNMVQITNSIRNLPHEIESVFNLIGSDVRYNWVNYSTLIGIEYLFSKSNLIFDNEINNNQVQYAIDFFDVERNNFIKDDV